MKTYITTHDRNPVTGVHYVTFEWENKTEIWKWNEHTLSRAHKWDGKRWRLIKGVRAWHITFQIKRYLGRV